MTAALAGLAVRTPGLDCETGDLIRGLGPSSARIEKLFGEWIHQVRACHIGEYLVVAPAQAGVAEILVARNGKPFFIASNSETMVMDEDHVLYDRERARKISVAAYNPAQRAWIEHVDIDADGTIDWRTTDAANRPPKHEVRLGDRWLEVSVRNGQSGTVLDGRFMSIGDARSYLGDRSIR
jgi:hypothetical protein